MGCDIHTIVEYECDWDKTRKAYFNYEPITLPRNYNVFCAMAGVRKYDDSIVPYALPRGLPSDHSVAVKYANWLFIDDEKGESYCTRAQAEQWGVEIKEDERFPMAFHPDWHSHSWLSTKEFAEALRIRGVGRVQVEYKAMLALMRSLPDARIVFWFDN